MSALVLTMLAWAMPFLLFHCAWCFIAGNVRLAAAELIMGMFGNALVCGLVLQLLGDPVPLARLFEAQFAGIALTGSLIRSLIGQG